MAVFTYENQGVETLLVCHLDRQEHVDSYAKGMLNSNEMAGILRPAFIQRDLEQYLKYPVTSRLPLKEYLQGEMEKDTVLNLCGSIVDAIQEIDDYMLGQEKLLLDQDYIFVDIRKKEVGLLYLPLDEFSQDMSVKEFLLQLLSHMQYRLDGDVSYVAKLIHFLNQQKVWESSKLRHYIRELLEEQQPKKEAEVVRREPHHVDRMAGGQLPADEGFARELSDGILSRPDVPQDPVKSSSLEVGTPIASDKEKSRKKGLFGRNAKKAEKTKPSKKTVMEPQMAIPGRMSIPVPKEQQPEVILNVDESGNYLPEQTPTEEKKNKGFFHFGKKKEQNKAAEELIDRPVIPEQATSTTTPIKQVGEIPPPASSAPLDFRQDREGVTVYIGHGSSDDENRTVIIGGGKDYGSTMILGVDKETKDSVLNHVVKITRRRTGQSMVMNKDLLHIGSEGSFVDLFIGDNPAIGSCHADIYEDSGSYYITDRNSVNHTYVDGIMAQPMQAVQLRNGSVIRLADEEFDFIIS